MLDLEKITACRLVHQFEFHTELSSTSDRALNLAASAAQATPLLVLADRQTAGRGRGVNRWWASEGALTFTLAVDMRPAWSVERRTQLGLAVGLAVRAAVERHAPERALVQVKWPNDVYLDGRKVCGILIETTCTTPPRAVIGIGINVNNSFDSAPDDVRRRAVALIDRCGRPGDRTAVLVDVLDELAEMLEQLEDDSFSLADAFAPHCLLTGKIVTIHMPGRAAGNEIVGLCRGIGDDGRLQIQTSTGLEQIAAGVVADWQ